MVLCAAKCESKARLDGKTVIITGGNTGIGKETALDLYQRGGNIFILSRNLDRAEEAIKSIKEDTKDKDNLGTISSGRLDLNSLQSVRECAKEMLERCPEIHILINNAGVMACPKNQTQDGFEYQLGVNHLGHFLLTCLLLPRIRASAPARIVNVSSVAHKYGVIDFNDLMMDKDYTPVKAYSNSKLANILFTKELAKRLEGQNVNVFVLHPGVVKTELYDNLNESYFPGLSWFMKNIGGIMMKNPKQGAQTNIYCAVDEKCANETGLYYSDCKVANCSSKANNMETAERLWNESAKLVKLGDWNPFAAPNTNTLPPPVVQEG